MMIRPLFDRILVKPVPEGHTTKGGLAIPDIARESRPYTYGDVIAVGTGRVQMDGTVCPLHVKEGDVVAYPRKAGTPIPMIDADGNETTVIMIREPDLVGIVEGLPRDTGLIFTDGSRILAMRPNSRAMPDVAYKNREDLERAERAGFADEVHDDEPNDHT
jgi:chaperonin GroES